jgi:hypothetical protein
MICGVAGLQRKTAIGPCFSRVRLDFVGISSYLLYEVRKVELVPKHFEI